MRILIADKLSINCASTLAELGLDVVNQPDLTAEQIPDALEGVGAIVVRSTRVTAEALKRGRDLSLVIRAGAGVNTIDLPMASRRGIYVANCPGKNTAAVAELTIGMLVAADRQIVNATCAREAFPDDRKCTSLPGAPSGRQKKVYFHSIERKSSSIPIRALWYIDDKNHHYWFDHSTVAAPNSFRQYRLLLDSKDERSLQE